MELRVEKVKFRVLSEDVIAIIIEFEYGKTKYFRVILHFIDNMESKVFELSEKEFREFKKLMKRW